jgi:lysophospholipase L1-like esterase
MHCRSNIVRFVLSFALLSIGLGRLALAADADKPGAGAGATVDQSLPTLFIIGDSTVHNPLKGDEGWGDAIKPLFDRTRINVVNRAVGGRSSRTFLNEGHWKGILALAKSGDFVLMQFGHNDPGAIDDAKARGSLPGIGDETKTVTKVDGSGETVRTFGAYMDQYVTDAKAKGMTPIVCSWIPHCPKPKGTSPAVMPTLPMTPTTYTLWAQQIAEKEHVDFIDLNGIIWQHYAAYTPDELKTKFFAPDYTHTTPAGAALNAQCVVEGIRKLKDCALTKYLLPAANDRAAN